MDVFFDVYSGHNMGLEYVVAKNAMGSLDTLSLLFYKYLIAAVFVAFIRLKNEKGPLFRKRDVVLFFISAVAGYIFTDLCEYSAMLYMPISLVSIIVTFIPILSIVIEAVIYKRKTSFKVIIGVFICIFGVSLIVGVDWSILLEGRLIGYLLTFAVIFS